MERRLERQSSKPLPRQLKSVVAGLLRREMQDNPADVAEGREVGRGGGEALREQDGDDGQVRAHQLPLRRRRRRQGVHEHQQARQCKRVIRSII